MDFDDDDDDFDGDYVFPPRNPTEPDPFPQVFADTFYPAKAWAIAVAEKRAIDRMWAAMDLDKGHDIQRVGEFLATNQTETDRAWVRVAWLLDVRPKHDDQNYRGVEGKFLEELGDYATRDTSGSKTVHIAATAFWMNAMDSCDYLPPRGCWEWISDAAAIGFVCGVIEGAKQIRRLN